MTGGAQGVKPAPAGTIPAPLQSFSDRPGSAKSKMLDRLKAKGGAQPAEAPKPEAAKPEDSDQPEEVEDVENPGEVRDEEQDALMDEKKPKVDSDGKPIVEGKKKINPWKVIDQHKAERSKLEKEMAELRKQIVAPETRKSEVAELEALRKEKKELLDTLRFKDYEQHPDFKEKYDKPYKDAWKFSVRNLTGITKISEDGNRAIALSREDLANDLLELVNMTTPKARERAEEMFGESANDVMIERDKIKAAFDQRSEALERARTEGAAKDEAEQKERREKAEALSSELKTIYDKANDYHSKDPKMREFFQPIDGDQEANDILEKGYKMVDEAFARSPMDPSLTPAERASLVKKHAAVRHRSAAFGRVRYLLQKERAERAEDRKKLEQYESTVPNRGVSKPAGTEAPAGGSKMQQMLSRLKARAK